jgi:hypothetical protein
MKKLSKVLSNFLGQFFHENRLFIEAFEIIIKIDGSLIMIFFQKLKLTTPKI